MRPRLPWLILGFLLSGCSAIPDVAHQPQVHNPFPQLSRVAVLPFYNQSADPTVDQDQLAMAYYAELQQIPGFEVMPVGVAKQYLRASGKEPQTGEDFQKLAEFMGVDAVVVGSVTEYTPYYPPRMGLSVRWYAANPGFHPIPPGYGLPWGTSEEEFIPDSLVFDAEFALAQEQLRTQTPRPFEEGTSGAEPAAAAQRPVGGRQEDAMPPPPAAAAGPSLSAPATSAAQNTTPSDLPADWPDPRGFIPRPPSASPPAFRPQSEPILRHTRLYQGNDADFSKRLAQYYYFRDDARFGGWQAYLLRSEDFIRFCCYLHISEMLAARGGAGKSRVVWRWPIGRYEP